MAKKKEAALTPKERLQAALVPDCEQPFKVPENWAYYRVSGLTERLKRGKAPKYVEASEYPVFAQKCNQKDGTIAMEKAQFLDPDLVEKIDDEEFLKDCDIIVNSTGTGTLGRVGFYRAEFASSYKKVLPDSHITVIRPNRGVFPLYLFFFLKYNQEYLELQGVGTTNQKELKPESIGCILLPLPPLAEQQRIVGRIESMFSKLDKAKETAQAVVDGFENRKAAVLHKAITGELTVQWRKDRGIGMDSWKNKRLDEVCTSKAGYAFDSKTFGMIGYQIIRMGNLYGGKLDLSRSPVFIEDKRLDESAIQKALIHDGDILITLTGTKYKRDYGYAVRIENPPKLLLNQRILCLSPRETVVGNYILYYLQSDIFRNVFFSNETGGVNQGNVSSKFVEKIKIKIPSIDEQLRIVDVLENIIYKEQQAKESAEAVLEQIDLIKKAILARSFRGELGTNDPNDESVVELLNNLYNV